MAQIPTPVNNYSSSGLAPASGIRPKVLILGSYPSELSLINHEYYGNPRNQFWKIMGMLFSLNSGFPGFPYRERLNILASHGIALWDVIETCSRTGSSDSSIGNALPNDIRAFLHDNPSVRCIGLNGKTGAGHWFQRHFPDLLHDETTGLTVLPLPSTSPAYAGMSIAEKTLVWQQILPFCTVPK